MTRLILPLVFTLGLPAIGFLLLGPMPFYVFGFATLGGLALYLATLWRRRIDTREVLLPYLLAVILFIAHVAEEYFTDFETVIGTLSGVPVSEEAFLFVAGFLAPVLMLGGAVLIHLRHPMGDYMLCFFFVAMALAELSHFLFPYLIRGHLHYVSGMYTAALPLIPAVWGLWRMLQLWRAVA